MATYYVRPDGSNANAGTGSASGQAWQTVQHALTNATLTAGVNYIYIAPGVYRESVTLNITPTLSNTLVISGDPTAAQFTGVAQGVVRLTNFVTDNATPSGSRVFQSTSKSYFTLENMFIDGVYQATTLGDGLVTILTGTDITIRKNSIVNTQYGEQFPAACYISIAASNTNIVVERCYFQSSGALMISIPTSGTVYNPQVLIKNCHMYGRYAGLIIAGPGTVPSTSNGVNIYNCTIIGIERCIALSTSNTSTPSTLYNSLLIGLSNTAVGIVNSTVGSLTENFNKIRVATAATGISTFGANTTTAGAYGIDLNYSRIVGLPNLSALQSHYLSPNANAGTSSGAPATDIYGVTWSGVNPDIGAGTYATPGNVGVYNPTERNASTITIAPGSTSQSIELYLGATGLTASTSGLSARYNRTRTASVSIPLVARTIDQSAPASAGVWISGGFAEVDSTNMPGIYRLDLPDAALAAGADDVTIVVRGASGTNGAVMTIKLSSGGLTAAQTAQAVLDATASIHNNIGSIGASIQDKAGYSLSTPQSFSTTGSVGSVTGNVAGNVVGTVGGVAGNVTGNIAGSVATVASPDNIIDGVWDEQRVGHTASGSFGEKLQTNALADEMLARDLGSGLNAGTAEERTVRSALRAIRNKVNVGSSQMVVKKEDDTTDAWTASVTTTAVSSNVSGIDPN